MGVFRARRAVRGFHPGPTAKHLSQRSNDYLELSYYRKSTPVLALGFPGVGLTDFSNTGWL